MLIFASVVARQAPTTLAKIDFLRLHAVNPLANAFYLRKLVARPWKRSTQLIDKRSP
jgi:hypothetical protein